KFSLDCRRKVKSRWLKALDFKSSVFSLNLAANRLMLPDFDNLEVAFRYRSTSALRRARFLFSMMRYPGVTRLGIQLVQFALHWNLPVKGLIRKTIFSQFCGGETLEEAGATARHLGSFNVSVILDYGVEGKSTEADFDRVLEEIRQAILYAGKEADIPFISTKITGLARFELLAKIHRGEALDEAEQREWDRVKTRMHSL